jgi:putative CocE/NonD family hydrolase
VEDLVRMAKEHPLFDEYWASKNPELENITVPAFVVANWGDHGLHTRGSLEGFRRISSKEKYLLVHGRKKWQFYRQMVDMQRKFFDRYLKGVENEVKYWPRVILEVRERYMWGNFRNENEWPPARTEYRKLFLQENGRLGASCPQRESTLRYDPETGGAEFEYVFMERTELTGYMNLRLWVEAEGSDDMDLFVAIQKYDRDGEPVRFLHNVYPFENAPAALGWLRVSHRELDEKTSTFYQPVYKHERILTLKPKEIVPVEIEIWPTSILFKEGERLRLIISGKDILSYPGFAHPETVNRGLHLIHLGGRYDSYLLVPVVP